MFNFSYKINTRLDFHLTDFCGLAFLLAAIAFTVTTVDGQTVIYETDFEESSVGQISAADLKSDWNSPSFDNRPSSFGENFRWDDHSSGRWAEFESGRWYQVRQRVVMNTPRMNDEIVQVWLAGRLVLNQRNLRFRDSDDLANDGLYFSTIFGGSSNSWQTKNDEWVYFFNFQITAQSTDPATLAPLGHETRSLSSLKSKKLVR